MSHWGGSSKRKKQNTTPSLTCAEGVMEAEGKGKAGGKELPRDL